MTTAEQTTQARPDHDHPAPAASTTVAKKTSSNRKRKSAKMTPAPKADRPGPFEVRVDDAGTVMPSFWRFGA